MAHSAYGIACQAIRLALEADARAETVNKVSETKDFNDFQCFLSKEKERKAKKVKKKSEVLKPLLAVDGPFEEVGAGSCRDVRGPLGGDDIHCFLL